MKIAVSDEILSGVEITPEEAVLDFAVGLYSEGKVTLGRAAEVAGLTQSELLKELGKRHIPIHYSMDDLKSDIQVVRENRILSRRKRSAFCS